DASELFSATTAELGHPNLRCFRYQDRFLAPVQSFVDRLVALRADAPGRLVVAGLVGIPLELGCDLDDMEGSDFQCVLDDPGMQQVELDEFSLVPACRVQAGTGGAYPARRIVQTIAGVDAA